MRDTVISKLKDIVSLFVEDEEGEVIIENDDILVSDTYGLDSIALVSIIVEIERVFEVEIDDEYLTMDFLSTIDSMADFVIELLEEKESG